MTKARDIADGVDTADIADGAISTAKLADNSINATKIDVSGNGTAGQFLSSDGDGTMTWADAGGGFAYNAPTGTSQTWDIGSYNYFNMGTLSGNTTVAFSNVPTEASWEFKVKGGEQTNAWDLTKSGKQHTFNPYNDLLDNSITATTTNNWGGLHFKSDGTEMYVLFQDKVYQWTLSTAWRLDSATYTRAFDYKAAGNFGGVGGSYTDATGLFFKDDGTKMYLVGIGDDGSIDRDGVDEYTLSTAWDISTAGTPTFANLGGLVPRGRSFCRGIFIGNSGTKLYLWHTGNDPNEGVWEYTLSTAWNTSTASYVRNVDTSSSGIDVVGTTANGRDIAFKSDGTQMYFLKYDSSETGKVVIADLSTAWDISTATVSSKGNKTYGIGFYVTSDKFFSHTNGTGLIYSINNSTPYTLTLPSSVNIDGLSASNNVLSPTFNQEYIYRMVTSDGGTNVTNINVGSEDLF